MDETLASSGRVLRRRVRDSATSTVLSDTTFGYAGGSDSPAYEITASVVTTYLGGASGILTGVQGGTATYPIANAEGDIVGTTDAAGAFTPVPLANEWGVGTTPDSRLGFLGDHQRYAVGGTLGLVRMGVRLYDPALGRFLSVDPIEGGTTTNDYGYMADSVNNFDLSGEGGRRCRNAGTGGTTTAEPSGTSIRVGHAGGAW